MKRFQKIRLLLSVISIIGLQSYMVQAREFEEGAGRPDTEDISLSYQPVQVSAWMRYCEFSKDNSLSPLKGPEDASSCLVDVVAGYMRAGEGETLHGLFYEPKVDTWRTVYRRAGLGAFSTVGLIDLLDRTKTRICEGYIASAVEVTLSDPYIYMVSLLNKAMQKIYTGCWGFSNRPLEEGERTRLLGIYGRVVSVAFTVDGRSIIIKSLQKKRQEAKTAREEGHFTVLQECVAAIVYKNAELRDPINKDRLLGEFYEKHKLNLSSSSVEQTMKYVSYSNLLIDALRSASFDISSCGLFDDTEYDYYIYYRMRCFMNARVGTKYVEALVEGNTPEELDLMVAMLPLSDDTRSLFSKADLLTSDQLDDILAYLATLLDFSNEEQDELLALADQTFKRSCLFNRNTAFFWQRLIKSGSPFSTEKVKSICLKPRIEKAEKSSRL